MLCLCQSPCCTPGNHGSFYCLHSFAFFRMTCSWNLASCTYGSALSFHDLIAHLFLALNIISLSGCTMLIHSSTLSSVWAVFFSTLLLSTSKLNPAFQNYICSLLPGHEHLEKAAKQRGLQLEVTGTWPKLLKNQNETKT